MIQMFKSKRVLGGGAVIAVLSFLTATVGNGVLGKYLQLPEDAELTGFSLAADGGDAPRPPRKPQVRSQAAYKTPIVKRNIFDSTAVPVESTGGEPGVKLSDLKVSLIATMVAVPGTFSTALIAEDSKDGSVQSYRQGQLLMGSATIVEIQQKRVKLEVNGEEEWIEISDEARPKKTASAGKRNKKAKDDGESGITKEGGKIIVERRVVDEAMQNIDSLATKIRVVPHKDGDGQVDGYRLSAIRRGSLFDKLGIKNGDVVHGVNGMPLTSTDGAFSAFQTLQSESGFTFDVTRRNKKQTFEYEIR